MNLSLFIAKRYFFSKKKRSFINVISMLSMLGVCVGSMAFVIVLSVFNGLEGLNRMIFKAQDPDLKIELIEGKGFELENAAVAKIKQIEAVSFVNPVIEDNALARNGDAQMVVVIKGVESEFERISPLRNSVVEGGLFVERDSIPYAFVGGGVYTMLGVNVQDFLYPLEIWYPRNQKLNVLNPEDNINTIAVPVSGVFSLEQQFDDIIFLPITLAEKLTDYQGKRTAIEVYLSDEKATNKAKAELKDIMGERFTVKDRDEQNEALFKAIKIEKLFIFVSLLLIIGIASFNIFFSLTMLVIDKQDDIQTLSALGARRNLVQRIFFTEGAMIAFIGASIGLTLGAIICWLQMQFGFVTMGMQSAIVDAYPVEMKLEDFIYAALGIIIITIIAAFFPARRAVAYMK
ncbi:MAG: ABC transporter permease [Spirosomaceae bacterium]|nr:ABC transporter permease [Spirosomataceae bacterium]